MTRVTPTSYAGACGRARVHACKYASHASHASQTPALPSGRACDAYARACVTSVTSPVLEEERRKILGIVVALPVSTPLEHARERLWHYAQRCEHLRAAGFTRAAAEAQRLELAWTARAIELSRARRRRPALPAGPSQAASHTGRIEREVALVVGLGIS